MTMKKMSYFEWVQNIQSMARDLEEVNRTLKKIMNKAYDEVDEGVNFFVSLKLEVPFSWN